jgi:hypothetical protein
MTTPNTLTEIERVLLAKEVAFLNQEIQKANKIISDAVTRYATCPNQHIPVTKSDVAAFNEFFMSRQPADSSYYAGDYLTIRGGSIPAEVPEFMQRIMLKKAVSEMMEKLDGLEELQDGLRSLQG